MALDTRNRRAAAIGVSLPWRGLLPVPDGAIDTSDRWQASYMFRKAVESTAAAHMFLELVSEHFSRSGSHIEMQTNARLDAETFARPRLTDEFFLGAS
jgi:hypothetical protein